MRTGEAASFSNLSGALGNDSLFGVKMLYCMAMKQGTEAETPWSSGDSGGHYELAILLEGRSDAQLRAILKALWEHPALEGCYKTARDIRRPDRKRLSTDDIPFSRAIHAHGWATLPNGAQVDCMSYIKRDRDDPGYFAFDALVFAVPSESIAYAYRDVLDEWGDGLAWKEIDRWFADIGLYLYEKVPYLFGRIGFEIGGSIVEATSLKTRLTMLTLGNTLSPVNGDILFFPCGDEAYIPNRVTRHP
jgi:hypothetical protein